MRSIFPLNLIFAHALYGRDGQLLRCLGSSPEGCRAPHAERRQQCAGTEWLFSCFSFNF